MTVRSQYHSEFKVFLGVPGNDPSDAIEQIATQVEGWSAAKAAAPKSIGVEYLEGPKLLVLTVGYEEVDEGAGYSVRIQHESLGQQFPPGATLDTERTARAMEMAAAKLTGVLCHEFFVTESGEMILVLMSHVE